MKSYVEHKRVFSLLPAIFALGWILHGQVFGVQVQQISLSEVSKNHEETAQRSPASIVEKSRSVLLFNCLQPQVPQKDADFPLLRILGENCTEESKVSINHIEKNLPAEVFWIKKNQFSTDLIRLNKGINNLEIVFNRDSKVEKHHLRIHYSNKPKTTQ